MKNISKKILLLISVLVLMVLIPSAKTSAEEPYVILESYEIVSGEAQPGSNISVKLVFKNTSTYLDTGNILVTYSGTTEGVYSIYGKSNQVYISNIPAEGTYDVTVDLTIDADISVENAALNFSLQYESAEYDDSNNNFMINLPIKQQSKLDITNISVANTSTVGASSLISIGYANTGITELSHVTLVIEGDVDDGRKEIGLGDISAGETKNYDYYVSFSEEGTKQITVSFTYEDEDGTVYSIEGRKYNVNVVKGTYTVNGNDATGQISNGGVSNIAIIAAIIVIFFAITIGTVFIIVKRRK